MHYAEARQRNQLNPAQRTSLQTLRKRSMRQVENLVEAAVPPSMRAESPSWPKVDPSVDWHIEPFTQSLRRFLSRGDHLSRQIIDELLIAYFQRGFGLKGAVERAHLDYETASEDVLPLEIMDLLAYAAFVWNFDTPHDRADAFAEGYLSGRRRAVYEGERTLRDVRLSAGIVRGFNSGEELRRMASINTKLAQELSQELLEGGVDVEESRKYKDIASFQNTTVNIVRAAREIGNSEEEGLRLQQFFDEVWEDVDEDIEDYEELEDRDTSPEELQAENQEVEASLPPKEGSDTDKRGY